MAETILTWRNVRGDPSWRQGYSGEIMVADVELIFGRDNEARWTLSWMGSRPADRCHSRAFSVPSGDAPSIEEAMAAAEDGWRDWLALAGLAPVVIYEPAETPHG